MAFDGLMVKAVSEELNQQLVHGRVERVVQPNKEEIVFQIRKPGASLRLLISTHPELARIHLTETNRPNPSTPPAFCMLLRKHLEGARIVSIEQVGFERIIHIWLETYEHAHKPTSKLLIFELTGRHSNLILIDPESGLVLDGAKRIIEGQSRHRQLIPNILYTPPPAQDKVDPFVIDTYQGFTGLLDSFEDTGITITQLLNQSFMNISGLTVKEILHRVNLNPSSHWTDLSETGRKGLWENFYSLLNQEVWQPHLIKKANQFGYEDYSPVKPTGLPESLLIPFSSTNQMLDYYFTETANQAILHNQKANLLRTITQEVKRYRKKIDLQQRDLHQAEKGDQWKIKGELLLSNLYQLQGGEKQVQVDNYYELDCPTVTIELNPILSPSQNAQSMFKKYNKAKSAITQLTKQLEVNRQEVSYLEGLIYSIEATENLELLEEIKEELRSQGYTKHRASYSKKDKKKPVTSRPLQFLSSDGFTILVGRNNTQNDYVTFRMAKGDDIWLHTKDIPGSHVIIKNQYSNNVPESTLEEGAILAAYFSKGRQSSNVPVDYTTKKNVRKPPGAKPGMVIYDYYKTAFVNPQNQKLEES